MEGLGLHTLCVVDGMIADSCWGAGQIDMWHILSEHGFRSAVRAFQDQMMKQLAIYFSVCIGV